MSDHVVRFAYANEYVEAELVCLADADAACRWSPDCDCETYGGLARDGHGWFHTALDYDEAKDEEVEAQHRHHPSSGCNVSDWVNAESALDCGPNGHFMLMDLPVDVTWKDDYYQWTPAGSREDRDQAQAEDGGGKHFSHATAP